MKFSISVLLTIIFLPLEFILFFVHYVSILVNAGIIITFVQEIQDSISNFKQYVLSHFEKE